MLTNAGREGKATEELWVDQGPSGKKTRATGRPVPHSAKLEIKTRNSGGSPFTSRECGAERRCDDADVTSASFFDLSLEGAESTSSALQPFADRLRAGDGVAATAAAAPAAIDRRDSGRESSRVDGG